MKSLNIPYKYILFFCSCLFFAGCHSYMNNSSQGEKAEYVILMKRYKHKDKKAKTGKIELTEEERHDFLRLIKKFRRKCVKAPVPQMPMEGRGEVDIPPYGSIRILFDDSFQSIYVPGKKADKETNRELYQLMDKIDNRLFESKE